MLIEDMLRLRFCRAYHTRWMVSMLIMSEDAKPEHPHVAAMGWRCMNPSTAWQAGSKPTD